MHSPVPIEAILFELDRDVNVVAVILFGSHARASGVLGAADAFSDYDLHVVALSVASLECKDWRMVLRGAACGLHSVGCASNGVRKMVWICEDCEVDMVVVPAYKMVVVRIMMFCRVLSMFPKARKAVNDLATIMSGGCRVVKGGWWWSAFYQRELPGLPGFRLSNRDLCAIAEANIVSVVKLIKKVRRGELVAARRVLHVDVIENNINILHEFRLRSGVVSFQRGRRVEEFCDSRQLEWVLGGGRQCQVIEDQALVALRGTIDMMAKLVPEWQAPSVFLGSLGVRL